MADDGMRTLAAAYEGLEDPSSFADRGALERYREGMLARSMPQADFLERLLPADARILEVACGNGRLLIEMARRGALGSAYGVDVAQSRITFARDWASEADLAGLEFDAADALSHPLGEGYDAAICITGAFAYFEPIAAGSAATLARRMHDALAPGGLLVLELYPHPGYIPHLEAGGGEVRLWKELDPEDPWRFYLSHLALDDSGRVLTHEKTFVHRTSGEIDSGRRERLQLYSERELAELLTGAGFEPPRFHEGWSDEPYAGGELMLAVSRRPSGRAAPTG